MLANKSEKDEKKAQADKHFRALLADLQSQIAQVEIKIRETEDAIAEAQRDIDMLANRIAVLTTVQSDLRSGKTLSARYNKG